jgi:uncharacterized repeat protein (TIGR01451 family)
MVVSRFDDCRRTPFGVALLVAIATLALIPRLAHGAPDLALQMTVNTPVPTAGQPVEFTVTVSNVGVDASTGVVVTNKLPPELVVPAGLAVFPSVGTYDPATGAWTVGSLAAGASATLVIPAIVAVTPQPPCSVNVASVTAGLDANPANNRALAAVRRNATDRCVDLSVKVNRNVFPGCVTATALNNGAVVTNQGPDDATNVLVDLSETPTVAPELRLTGPAGTPCNGTRCSVVLLPVGARLVLNATSDFFRNQTPVSHTVSLAVSSSDTDYLTTDNQASVSESLPAVSDKCSTSTKADEGWGGAGAGCFIATAAFGSPLEPHVRALRQFRDRYLQRTELGRAFIRFYYRHSPPLATVIAQHAWLRFVARMLLTPLVLAIAFPLHAVMLLALAVAAVRSRRFRAAVH